MNFDQEPSKSGNRPGFQYILKFYKFQEWNEAFTLADKYPEYREQVRLNNISKTPSKSGKQEGNTIFYLPFDFRFGLLVNCSETKDILRAN